MKGEQFAMNKGLKKILSLLLACVIILGVVACKKMPTQEAAEPAPSPGGADAAISGAAATGGPEDSEAVDGDLISVSFLASSLKEKYTNSETAQYQTPLWAVPANHEFYVDLEFDIVNDTEYENSDQIFCVYADAELTKIVSTTNEIITHDKDPSIPEGHNRFYIRPYRYPPGRVIGTYSDLVTDAEIKLGGPYDNYLHETGPGDTWGYLNCFYLTLKVDVKTSETLYKPQVTIFTIDNQLEAPQSKFYVTEDGYAAFRWEPVEGADYYLIVRIDDENPLNSVLWPIDKATGTNWVHPKDPTDLTMNRAFRAFDLILGSEDDMINAAAGQELREPAFENYTVIAVNGETHSPVGTIHRGEDITARLAYKEAYYTNRQNAQKTGGSLKYFPGIGQLPVKWAITMASGATVYRRMLYDFDSAEVRVDRYASYDEGPDGEMINIEFTDSTNLYITYVIEGTCFTDYSIVEDINPDTWKKELAVKRRQQEDAAARGGGVSGISLESRSKTDDSPSAKDAPPEILDMSEERVYANCALSEYLARNMLACNEYIDLTQFPESADLEFLMDAFFEAMYQNPLIMHVEGAGYIPGTNIIAVQYSQSRKAIINKQKEIRAVIPGVIAEIITPGMSVSEKSYAINQYLTDTAEYDYAALENAEKNDFQYVDAIFDDSFTAYGILIGKVGVCAGYAAAYKLLADEAGLEAIVVTGFLDGMLPHAWNRVNISGQWYTVDVTNNDGEFIDNVIMHLPDKAIRNVLVEDSLYVMDAYLSRYKASGDNSEYYRYSGRYYEKSEIASQLARLVRQNGVATLRTDYNLSDDEFYEIASKVAEELKTEELYGFYWLGVICLSDAA